MDLQPPTKADVIAACREPRWYTAAEITAEIEFYRGLNAFFLRHEAKKPVVKTKHAKKASILTSLKV